MIVLSVMTGILLVTLVFIILREKYLDKSWKKETSDWLNTIRRATGKDKVFCEELYKTHGDFRIAIEYYRSNAGWIF
jgi:hypothetical protein